MLKFIGVLILLSPLSNDVNYILFYSDKSIVGAVLFGVFLTALRIVLGLIAGGIVLCIIYAVIKIISDDLGVLIGSIAGIIAFMIVYFIPVIMTAAIK